MEFDKERFFSIIDFDDHFNSKTKEAYWNFFREKCGQDVETLYRKGDTLYPEKEGLHQYVKLSISKQYNFNHDEDAIGQDERSSVEDSSSKILPIDDGINHESATTWGSNDDVKNK